MGFDFDLYDPTTQEDSAAVQLAPRPDDLRGKRLVLMDNGKNNARELLEAVLGVLEPELQPADVIWKKVPATVPASDELLDEIAKEADLVIEAVGD
jgi:hypothetical protein